MCCIKLIIVSSTVNFSLSKKTAVKFRQFQKLGDPILQNSNRSICNEKVLWMSCGFSVTSYITAKFFFLLRGIQLDLTGQMESCHIVGTDIYLFNFHLLSFKDMWVRQSNVFFFALWYLLLWIKMKLFCHQYFNKPNYRHEMVLKYYIIQKWIRRWDMRTSSAYLEEDQYWKVLKWRMHENSQNKISFPSVTGKSPYDFGCAAVEISLIPMLKSESKPLKRLTLDLNSWSDPYKI